MPRALDNGNVVFVCVCLFLEKLQINYSVTKKLVSHATRFVYAFSNILVTLPSKINLSEWYRNTTNKLVPILFRNVDFTGTDSVSMHSTIIVHCYNTPSALWPWYIAVRYKNGTTTWCRLCTEQVLLKCLFTLPDRHDGGAKLIQKSQQSGLVTFIHRLF
jgi:hypothetical protein